MAPPCSGPHKRAHARGARGEEVRPGRAHDADRRGAAILLVIGVKDEDQVQGVLDLRRHNVLLIGDGEHHVEEVRAIPQVRVGVNKRQPLRAAVRKRRDRADLADQSRGSLLQRRVAVQGDQFLMETGQIAQRRGKDGHRRGVRLNVLILVLLAFVQQLIPRQPRAEAVQLLLAGQPAENQQPGDLDEIGLLGELLDGDAPIAKDALLPVDEGDGALADAGVSQRGVIGDQAGLLSQPRNVHGALALRSDEDGQFDRLVADSQGGFFWHDRSR